MKHYTLVTLASIGAFCSLVTLPALAAPTGIITSNTITKRTVIDPNGGPPSVEIVATTKHQINNDQTYTFTAYFEDNFSTQDPNPANTYAPNSGKSKLTQVPPKRKSPIIQLEATLGYFGPNWVYTSSATLYDANKIGPFPEDWLDHKLVSQTIP